MVFVRDFLAVGLLLDWRAVSIHPPFLDLGNSRHHELETDSGSVGENAEKSCADHGCQGHGKEASATV